MSHVENEAFSYWVPKKTKAPRGHQFLAEWNGSLSSVLVNYPEVTEEGAFGTTTGTVLGLLDRFGALLAAIPEPQSNRVADPTLLESVLGAVVSAKIGRGALEPFVRVASAFLGIKSPEFKSAMPEPVKPTNLARCESGALGQWRVDCWLNEERELGPLPRFLVILAVLHDADPQGWIKTLKTHASVSHDGAFDMQSELDKLVNVVVGNSNEGYREDNVYMRASHVTAAMESALNDLRLRSGLSPLSYQQIQLTRLAPVHANALDDLKQWLRAGVWRCTHQADLMRTAVDKPRRSTTGADVAVPDELVSAVRTQVLNSGSAKPIVLLHSIERPRLLWRVAVAALAKELKNEHPRQGDWCVVELRASAPEDRDFEWTVRQFLTPLASALKVPLWMTGRPPTPEQVEAALESLREGLSRSRCILVVDGLQTAGTSRFAPLFDFLSGGAPVHDLIRALALPWFGRCHPRRAGPTSVEPLSIQLGLTRILVLCNQPCSSLLSLAQEPIDADGYFQASDPSEICLSIQKCRDNIGDRTPDVSNSMAEQEIKALVAHLLNGKPGRVEWLLLLGFIAAVPDGLFAQSMQRVFDLWWQLVTANSADTFTTSRLAMLHGRVRSAIEALMARNAPLKSADTSTAASFTSSAQARLAPEDFFEKVGGFVQCFRPLLSVDVEQVTEGLGERHLQWEVGTLQSDRERRHASELDAHNRGMYRRRISFSSLWVRDLFIKVFRSLQETSDVCGDAPIVGERAWKMLHFAAAGECLRQSTALLRNALPSDLRSLGRYRRVVQCIAHITAASDMKGIKLPGAGDDSFDHQRLLLPSDPDQLQWFSYAVLYARILEKKEWRTTRNWGRSELRTALLLLMLSPGEEPRTIVRGQARTAIEADAMPRGAAAQPEPPGPHLLVAQLSRMLEERFFSRPQASLRDAQRVRAILSNLAYAAVDAEDRWIADMANSMIEQLAKHAFDAGLSVQGLSVEGKGRLKGARLDISVSLRLLDGPAFDVEQVKTKFDVAEIGGHALNDALQTSRAFIESFDGGLVAQSIHSAVESTMDALLDTATGGRDFQPQGLQTKLMTPLMEIVAPWSGEQLQGLVDVLARLASALASLADDHRDDRFNNDPDVAVQEMARAWATFHVADALRGRVGQIAAGDRAPWGMISSRSWRAGVRATLALARMLIKQAVALGGRDSAPNRVQVADFLFEYARARADILVRDTHDSDRERVFATLLQCGVVRSIACADFDLDGGRRLGTGDGLKPEDPLRDAIEYVTSAERRLLALGNPPVLLRRHLVERIATLGALYHRRAKKRQPGPEAATVEAMLRNDLLLLDGLARGSAFWERLYEQHMSRFIKASTSAPRSKARPAQAASPAA